MTSSDAADVVILGSGVAGLAAALAADELGLHPLVLEKASTLGGGTVHSYGLIWVGQRWNSSRGAVCVFTSCAASPTTLTVRPRARTQRGGPSKPT